MHCSRIEKVRVWGSDLAALISRADDPPVTNLSCGIIPHRLFPLRKWYYANPIWYYHAPAEHHQIIRNGDFYSLVDPELRELCRVVLEAGLCTTPSCQGHFYLRERFEKIWCELQWEEEAIRSGGLVVIDCENSGRAVFKEPGYSLPWDSFEVFYDEVARTQEEGYIGIVIPTDRQALVERLASDGFEQASTLIRHDPELSEAFGQPIVGVHVHADSIKSRDEAWREVTEYFRQLLHDN